MIHDIMIAAHWPFTWAILTWGALGVFLAWVFSRISRSQPATPIPLPQADIAIGYLDVRAMLDAPGSPWKPEDLEILAGRRLP